MWVAANVDATLPTERGLLPGNGSMVAALKAATDTEPQVAGKPAPTLLLDALARGDFQTPLVVGDRLNTDIAGANAAELPSLMVLTGVNSARDAVYAVPDQRATFIGHDLRVAAPARGRARGGPAIGVARRHRRHAITGQPPQATTTATGFRSCAPSPTPSGQHQATTVRGRRRHRTRRPATVVPDEIPYRRTAMTTDPEEIRARIDDILAELPDPANPENLPTEADLEELARQLSEAHDMLVQALESAEKA